MHKPILVIRWIGGVRAMGGVRLLHAMCGMLCVLCCMMYTVCCMVYGLWCMLCDVRRVLYVECGVHELRCYCSSMRLSLSRAFCSFH